jgi:hypothetical protein
LLYQPTKTEDEERFVEKRIEEIRSMTSLINTLHEKLESLKPQCTQLLQSLERGPLVQNELFGILQADYRIESKDKDSARQTIIQFEKEIDRLLKSFL